LAAALANWPEELKRIWVPRTDGAPVVTLSDEWHQARRGRLTASRAASVIANMNPSALRTLAAKLHDQLRPEWVHEEGFQNEAMDRGNRIEAQALANLELNLGAEVLERTARTAEPHLTDSSAPIPRFRSRARSWCPGI
jgi:hypothetical protein